MSSFRLQETIRPTLTTPLNTCLSRRYETDVCAVTGKLYVKLRATRDYPSDLNYTTKLLSLKEIEIDVCAVTGKLYVKFQATRDYPSDLNCTTKHLSLKKIRDVPSRGSYMSSLGLQETIRPTLTTSLNTCLSRRYETDVCAVTGKLYVKLRATRDYPSDLNYTTKHLSLKKIRDRRMCRHGEVICQA
ncbi:hypothetical protein RRG08_052990 [Elysia crispata]|uniref:Uncharacterized protein n=1 Tax=Elysia crispata TaxID=231223 RepID=A0AAE1E132_9GAST|nr:hypothetical protein RRG08_052990 [Elysia crispata]